MSERSDAEIDEIAGQLFQAGRAEPVPPEARARALEAIGSPQAPAAPAGGLPALVKWGGVALLALGAGAAWLATRQPPAPPASPPAPRAVATREAPPPPSPSASAATPALAPAVTAAPSERAPSPSVARRVTAPPGSADALAEELKALDRARSALRAGDAAGALQELARYDRAYPRGALRSEALMVRVEALVRSGRKTEAEKLAEPILTANPDGLAARRLKGLLE